MKFIAENFFTENLLKQKKKKRQCTSLTYC